MVMMQGTHLPQRSLGGSTLGWIWALELLPAASLPWSREGGPCPSYPFSSTPVCPPQPPLSGLTVPFRAGTSRHRVSTPLSLNCSCGPDGS